MKRLFQVVDQNGWRYPEFFEAKSAAKKVRDAHNAKKEARVFHVSRGPDHWRATPEGGNSHG